MTTTPLPESFWSCRASRTFPYIFPFRANFDIRDIHRIWILRITADDKRTNRDQRQVEWEKEPESEVTEMEINPTY